VPPDPKAMQHDELKKFGWRLIEHLPRRYIDMTSGSPAVVWSWSPFSGFYRYRTIAADSSLHKTVLERKADVPYYQPGNLPKSYTIDGN
jgi:hypothetical protein